MRLSITHRTEYLYERSVHHSIQELRLTPQDTANQFLERWKINAPSKLSEFIDAFGNVCHVFVLDTNYSGMLIESRGEVLTKDQFIFHDSKLAVSPFCLLQQTPLTEPSEEMIHYFSSKFSTLTPDNIVDLARCIKDTIVYKKGVTDTHTSASEAWEFQAGVCQDHTHIMLGICRYLGFPARYVSGYFFDENSPEFASHAWVDVCFDIDDAVWHSIDITNACFSNERHIRLAIGRDYAHVSPVKGIRSGGGVEELNTKVHIEKC
jgi:transglutaminase-like putative cysteine protease